MDQTLALIDCNNFFVSCERLFRPDLEGKPVVVLSSNDGCAISRSNEAKKLGVPMGAPVFKYRQLFKEQGVTVFSANFELYGDISHRLTRLLTSITPRTEIYSVDESFIDLSELNITDYGQWSRDLRQKILTEVGIPVSIGLAPSKTMAKIANHRAKQDDCPSGVLDLAHMAATERQTHLIKTPVNEIWGVGWRLAPRLRAEGIFTAADLAAMNPRLAQQLLGIHGRQMVAELNGTRCYQLEPFGRVRQSVMHGRMFGSDTSDPAVVEAAISSLTARAALRLRKDGLLARSAVVSLSTNRHKPGYERLSRYVGFRTPTADGGHITAELLKALKPAMGAKTQYHRANVLLYDLVSQHSLQADLFGEVNLVAHQNAASRLQAFDTINNRYGSGAIRYAAEDLSAAWTPKHDFRSPRYTSHWQDLPTLR
ncbi:MAG TPA: Y-family DNA polymerase [Candidatus Saccharimonadales bacterium]